MHTKLYVLANMRKALLITHAMNENKEKEI